MILQGLLSSMEWIATTNKLSNLMDEETVLTIDKIEQGFEAETVKINGSQQSFVMKIWNKQSKPNIAQQFELLLYLQAQHAAIAEPIGWGVDAAGNSVLLSSYNGTTIRKVNELQLAEIANILHQLHQINVPETLDMQLPSYSFTAYFYGGIEKYTDLLELFQLLMSNVDLQYTSVIHGDYHLGNLVEEDGQYTIIDWTNGQLGDKRFDLMWSIMLYKLYVSEYYAQLLLTAYLKQSDLQQEELHIFEALACVRWILLHKNGSVPVQSHTLKRVAAIMKSNRWLSTFEYKNMTITKKIQGGDQMGIDAMFAQFPILTSERIVLKQIEEQHVDDVYRIYSNEKVFEYCGIIPKNNKETVRKMIGHFVRDYSKGSRIKWGIFATNEPEQLLGIIEVFDCNKKVNMVTIGYYLAETYWNRGIATEAVRVLLDYLFDTIAINRVQAEVMPQNEVSKKVLLSNGFVKEGLLRQAVLWSNQGVVDIEIYSILRQEYWK